MVRKLLKGLLVLVGLVVVVIVGLSLLAKPAADHVFFTEGPPRPWVIAHQGGDGLWPSNTMVAFEQAADLGVDVLEMDMHSTADGVLVLMHDENVDRTTNGSGSINGQSLAELRELDAGYNWTPDDGLSYPYRDLGIVVPTLEEIFTAFPDQRLNIEIKQAEPSISEPFCQMVHDYDMTKKVLVASFKQEILNEFREVCPEVETSTGEREVITIYALSKLFLEAVYSPAAQAVQVPENRFGLAILTKSFIEAAHNRNMDVHAWTINEVSDMERILDMGVDGIITDRPDRLLGVLGR